MKLLLLICCVICSHSVLACNPDSSIIIIIKLKENKEKHPVSIKVAPLKYNKNFAFSFTLDDGLVSDYLVAYPFFNGGTVSGEYADQWGYDQGADGKNYPGLFYTDGCGNKAAFRAGLAINAKNINGADTLRNHGFLTWDQLEILSRSGWNILNHSYTHATGKDVNAKYEIEKNNEAIQSKLGISMKNFVIPGGHDDVFSNEPYTNAAFELGMETVQCEDFNNYLINIVPGIDLRQMKLGRLFMHSVSETINGKVKGNLHLRSGSNLSVPGTENAFFTNIDSLLNNNGICWINAFTHGVGNQDVWNISLLFPAFKTFFNKMATEYGWKGADNMWMAPTQEVYEYLLNKRSLRYNLKNRKKYMRVVMDKNTLPSGLRYHELTFIITGKIGINSVRCKGCFIESYSKRKSDNLVNIKWK